MRSEVPASGEVQELTRQFNALAAMFAVVNAIRADNVEIRVRPAPREEDESTIEASDGELEPDRPLNTHRTERE